MARSRLAVALVIPDPAATEIDGLRRAMGSRALGRIAPHVTLVPPVNVADERLADAVGVLERGAASGPPLWLEVGPPATFWPDTPVVYLSVGGDGDGVRRLREAVRVAPLDRRDPRPFVPHVTLDEHVDPERIPCALDLLGAFRVEVTVERVQLLQQDAQRRWDVIAEAPLGGSRVVGRGGLEVTLTAAEVLDPEAGEFFRRAWAAHLVASYGAIPRLKPFAIVARRERAVVGVAIGTHDDELVLDRLVVDPAVRGQGIGRHLLAEVESLTAARAVLTCQAGGDAQSWYEGRGWVVELRLPRWRHGRDFVRMARGGR